MFKRIEQVIAAYEPNADELRADWCGDEAARERAAARFVKARENNRTVHSVRGFGRKGLEAE